MKKIITIKVIAITMILFSFSLFSQTIKIRDLPTASSISNSDMIPIATASPLATKKVSILTLKDVFFPSSEGPLWYNVLNYGALGDNSNNDTPGIQAAIDAACISGGGMVYIPKGIYRVSSALTITCAGVMIEGEGPATTVIRTTSTTANVIKFGTSPSFSPCGGLQNVSIDSSVTRTTGSAIVVDNCEYGRVENVRIHTTGGNGISMSPTVGTLSGLWFFHGIDIEISGAFKGIIINGSNDQYFTDIWIRGTGVTGSRGVSITSSGGAWFTNVEAVLMEIGIDVVPASGQTVFWLNFTNTLADTNTLAGFNFNASAGGSIAGINCISCWSSSNGASVITGRGFSIVNGNGYSFVASRVINNGGHGFEISSNVSNISISNSIVSGNSNASSGVAHGIITTGVTGIRLTGNKVGQSSGTNNSQGYGIFLNTGSTNYSVVGNDTTSNVTGGINNPAAHAGSYIKSNLPASVNDIDLTAGGWTDSGTTVNLTTSTDKVGIGTSSPGEKLVVSENAATLPAHSVSGTTVHVASADGAANRLLLDAFGANAAIDFRNSSNTGTSPTATANATNLGQIGWFGRGSTVYSSGSRGSIRFLSTETWTDSAQGTLLSILVTPIGSVTAVERLRLSGEGNLALGGLSTFGTSASNTLTMGNGICPSTSPTDSTTLCVADSAAGDANLNLRSEAGNIERISSLRRRNTSQFDATSSTVLANVTGLTFNVEAGKIYGFTAELPTTSNSAGGVKFAIGGTATATNIWYYGDLNNAGTLTHTRVTSLGSTVCALTAVTAGDCSIKGVIIVNAAGTLTVQFAQNASNGTASSVLVNSRFYLEPISN